MPNSFCFIYMEWEVASTGMHRDLENKDNAEESNSQWQILKDLISGVNPKDIYGAEDDFWV